VTIRRATEDDRETLRELWQELAAEVPLPVGPEETWDEAWAAIARHIAEGVVLLAEDGDGPAGLAVVRRPEASRAHVTDAYVRPRARGRGVTKALLREVVADLKERGVEHVTLDVATSNALGRAVWERLGFVEFQRSLFTEIDRLEARVAEREAAPSYGSIHVQTDDERTVRQILDRVVPRSAGGIVVTPPRNGWTGVYVECCDEDRAAHRRLARELSEAMGVVVAFSLEEEAVVRFLLFDAGRMVDEYLSVPEYYGPLERVDVLGLAANPTLVARLTGADPGRVRTVARIADSASELPPARELLGEIRALMGIESASLGYRDASG
jgi:ribosomal protein S18 acetylase RimI-like enzyme